MDRVERDENRNNLVEQLALGNLPRPYKLSKPVYEQLYKDEGLMDFSEVIREMVKMNLSFQLQGRGGTGKTFFVQRFIEYLQRKGKTFLTLCPTHKACINLDSGLRLKEEVDKNPHKTYTLDSQWAIIKHTGSDPFNHYDWIIVDEKSFIKEGFWKHLLQIAHRFPKANYLFAGDWDQLPPVGDRSDFDYENSTAIWELCKGRMIELTHCRRADNKLFEMCKSGAAWP
jgi:hypothetical protein